MIKDLLRPGRGWTTVLSFIILPNSVLHSSNSRGKAFGFCLLPKCEFPSWSPKVWTASEARELMSATLPRHPPLYWQSPSYCQPACSDRRHLAQLVRKNPPGRFWNFCSLLGVTQQQPLESGDDKDSWPHVFATSVSLPPSSSDCYSHLKAEDQNFLVSLDAWAHRAQMPLLTSVV